MRTSVRIFLLAGLVLSFAVSTYAQEKLVKELYSNKNVPALLLAGRFPSDFSQGGGLRGILRYGLV